jgi:type VI secretion system protein ImpA
MASEQIIPIEQLLQPISEDNAVGIDIRDNSSPTSPYYSIKDARNAARAAERNNIFDSDNTEADNHWRKILELAPDILITESKDLEIASWYTEALVRRYGYQGLRDGFKLIYGLIENFWNELYPLPDEDGIETRVAPLTGLNGEGAEGVLIAPIRNIYITEGSSPGPFNYWMYQQALEVEKTLDEEIKRDKASKLGFSNEDVERAVSESSEQFYIDLVDDAQLSIDTYREISRILDEYCGINDSPPTSNITNVLEECLGAIKHIGKYKIPDTSSDDSDSESTENIDATSPGTGTVASNSSAKAIQTRADAFKKLIEISEFFRKTEPHSPISYILERAVKWGDMPLDELIRELIPDSSARDFYGSLTGVRTEDD